MKRALIVGGNGALGKAMVNSFKQKQWGVLSIDLTSNKQADANLILKAEDKLPDLQQIYSQTESFSKTFDSIVCVAGGFTVSNIKDEDCIEKYLEMDRVNFQSALLTGHLSTKYLDQMGLLVFTGAAAAFEGPVNFAYGYGMSKCATHHLAMHIAERQEIPKTSTVVTILPQTIDTPGNREAMADADKSEWQPTEKIAALVRSWAEGDNRPMNGSFAKLHYKNECMTSEFV
uniref:Dihydropteridine reductase n=1 Tax=Strombidium rassoulzadegani TaxID=1082188 RepID=A0A7S3FUQ0_9SPIT|mmetsp:Transcript_1660/g.2935  ORF Transcript_1660/g.2935 Transcript_1660/m.2935 type:complete len:231 (+) Transcript_1660:36-728(+)